MTRFLVFYRTGGTLSFTWHQVRERYVTRAQAIAARDGILRQGYHSFVAPEGTPLPVRFDAGMEP